MNVLTSTIYFDEKNTNSIKQAIYRLYDEYKKFINCPNMPKFNIEFYRVEPKQQPAAYISPHKDRDIKYTLHICIDALLTTLHRMVPTLYHEFTHIYDLEHYALHMPLDERSVYIRLFTEFHATMIQLKRGCGFENENSDKINVAIQSKYTDISPVINTLQDCLKVKAATWQQIVDEFNKDPNRDNFSIAVDYMCYALATKKFVQEYVGNDAYDIRNLGAFIMLFGDELPYIENALSNWEINDTTLEFLFNIYTCMKERLLNKSPKE